MAASRPEYRHQGFFLSRSPAYPWSTFDRWVGEHALGDIVRRADEGSLEERCREARERARAHLRRVVADRLFRDAIMLASPSLHASIEAWERGQDGPRERAVEAALVRYLGRMAGRPTPFGLFAGVSVGIFGATTDLRMSPRSEWQRRTRLDTGVLADALARLLEDPLVRSQVKLHPNSTLARAAGRLRHGCAQRIGKSRAYALMLTEETPHLAHVLEIARAGASMDDLVQGLVELDPEIAAEEAEAYVHQLIDVQLLDARMAPPVTSDDPLADVLDQLAPVTAAERLRSSLMSIRTGLAALDRDGITPPLERHQEVMASLEHLAPGASLAEAVQIDLMQPTGRMTLGEPVFEALVEGLRVVHRITARANEDPLFAFKRAFGERYENARVPLLTVLDDEAGIGFDSTRSPVAEGNPLLGGLLLDPPAPGSCVIPRGVIEVLLPELLRVAARGERVLELTDAMVERLSDTDARPPPDAVGICARIAAESIDALNAGRFQILFDFAVGPPGVRQLTRFSGLYPALDAGIREHLRREEALRSDCVFAEIVFLPHGRMGNIVGRPVLRDHEIVFLAVSGADEDQQIPLSDLDVCVVQDEVILWSNRLDRQIVPCLSNSHNYDKLGHTIYRFLCLLSSQRCESDIIWSWGDLGGLDFLPRLVHRNIVIEKAIWRIDPSRLRSIAAARSPDRYRAVCELRAELQLPRFIAIRHSDRELPFDLDNILGVDAFLDHAGRGRPLYITEVLPSPDELVVGSEDGPYVQQILVPAVRDGGQDAPDDRVRTVVRRVTDRQQRGVFFPGSEWVYLRLFAGEATAERIVGDALGPLARALLADALIDQWHFLRYGDPDWHLRVRFHGSAKHLLSEVYPRVLEALSPWLDDGGIWKLEHGTYRRELPRYGGDAGIRVAEQVFTADSGAVADLVGLYSGSDGVDARWRLAILGTDMLFDDLGLPLSAKLAVASGMRQYFGEEFRASSTRSKASLGAKYRASRAALEDLFGAPDVAAHPLAPGIECLRRRGRVIADLRDELRALEDSGIITREELAESYAHMFINRLMPSHQRAYELVIHDFLCRHYRSLQARRRKHP
ncbi:lantibiotic dehydratase [Paraliomyxa miuraensis]|uniref:lantibiotic dehydratase n=1 Tax=Paraliomyxa miuraensis TaxID=376150 RepID=UPI002257DC29|nr:lantibiotic dehydratase [Paraliomyxa miuraensis]MCX4247773.1 lantibiotic dehydratase [Paraliomyxa miuraensis]